jgi:peptidoglycan L-alanyl-D-glutamate endopeptidase CwlK
MAKLIMPKFGKRSTETLKTCHKDLQTLFNEVIQHYDCSVISGHRTPSEQYKLYQQGRKTKGPQVTQIDGYKKKSKHNYSPSLGVDVVPYPIEWKNLDRMKVFIGFVLGVAAMLKKKGEIKNTIISGIDWDNDTFYNDQLFKDHPHFQIK